MPLGNLGKKKPRPDPLVEVSARDFTVLVEQIMALRTEVRDALTKVEVGVRAQERAAQEARAAAERSRRHMDRAAAAMAGTVASPAGAGVVGEPLPPNDGEG